MIDMLMRVLPILRDGQRLAIATVSATQGSSPRQPGASMFVCEDGSAEGSVSGGCVESAVYESASEVIMDGSPRAERFGFSDDDAFAVGLTCGGIIDIFITRLGPDDVNWVSEVVADVEADRPVAVATVIEHDNQAWVGRRMIVRPSSATGSLGSALADHAIENDVRGQLASGSNTVLQYGTEGERMGHGMSVFVVSHQPKPRMIVFGAVDFAGAVADQARLLDFHVTVCDARKVFATPQRFPGADEVIVDWPHRYLARQIAEGRVDTRTTICVLTHDAKFDVPLLVKLLQLPEQQLPAYIGVMGSRRTHSLRLERLRAAGITDAELAHMSSPIGLDLKARTPAETAVSILAEVISARWGGSGVPLRSTVGPIH